MSPSEALEDGWRLDIQCEYNNASVLLLLLAVGEWKDINSIFSHHRNTPVCPLMCTIKKAKREMDAPLSYLRHTI
jgi:hypothetical protein